MNRMVFPVNLVLNWMYNGSQEPYGLENLGKKQKRKRKKDREPVKKRKERYICIIVIHIPTLHLIGSRGNFFNSKNHTYDSASHKNLYLFLAISSNFLSWFVWVDDWIELDLYFSWCWVGFGSCW